MDDSYIEYDSQANIDDGSCQNLIVYGCLNESADNYNPEANVDDGSCEIQGCMDFNYLEYNPWATSDDGSCLTFMIIACTNEMAQQFQSQANQDDGS